MKELGVSYRKMFQLLKLDLLNEVMADPTRKVVCVQVTTVTIMYIDNVMRFTIDY